MQPTRPLLPQRLTALLALAALLTTGLTLGACTVTDCGPGTHEENGECIPNTAVNCNGDNVVFLDGRCQVSPDVCGAGTAFDPTTRTCIAIGGGGDNNAANNNPNNANPNNSDPGDAGNNANSDNNDAGNNANNNTEDVDPDAPMAESCGATSPGGTVCVSGLVLNWATNAPVPADAPLGIIIDDLNLRIADPTKTEFGATALGPASSFIFRDVPVSSADGPLMQMILITAELPQPAAWMRTLTGVRDLAVDGTGYPGQIAYAIPLQLVQAWDAQLGRSGATSLVNTGFLLLRVLELRDGQPSPVAGATVANIDPGADAQIAERRYLDNDLTGFRAEQSTGPTGAVLLVGAPTGQYGATATGFAFQPTLGGSSPGVGIATAIFGVAQ